jgi:hypothetical protein
MHIPCGDTSLPPETPAADFLAVITDLPCALCEYNLRTRLLTARCPECDLAGSLRGR